MLPGKDPPERAQDWAFTPAVGTAAAPHGTHPFDETADDGEEHIQTNERFNDTPQHLLRLPRER